MAVRPIAQEDLDHILAHTVGLWEELRGQRVFLTGGTGFFGCWLLESFCHANRELALNATATVLTRNPDAFTQKAPHLASDPAIHIHAGDVRSFTFPPDDHAFIIHAATDSGGQQGASRALDLLDTIVEGTRHTLDFARTRGTRKFLLTSSGAVYGKQPSNLIHIPEDHHGAPDPLLAASNYGEGKRMAEHLCALYGAEAAQKTPEKVGFVNENDSESHSFACKIARCFAFVGPHLPLDAHFAIGNFMRDAMAGNAIEIGGDGTPHRSYLYAADLMIWLWTILFRGQPSRAYNVGSEDSLSIQQLAQAAADALHPSLRIHVAKRAIPGAPISRYVPSTQRAQHELGLSQRISLVDAMQRTARWHGPVTSGE